MIKKSLGLAQKLEECADIAQIYQMESDDADQKKHYQQIWKCLEGLHQIHTGTMLVEYIRMEVYFGQD